jgi:hypothetical protein
MIQRTRISPLIFVVTDISNVSFNTLIVGYLLFFRKYLAFKNTVISFFQ